MAEAFKQLGEAVAGIFQERYYADQMKQFRENELAEFNAETENALTTIQASPDDPELLSNAFLHYSSFYVPAKCQRYE
jgi:hypothetical protein